MLQEDGRIVLTDFELARAVGIAQTTEEEEFQTITRSGTVGFIAPEVGTINICRIRSNPTHLILPVTVG